MPVTNCPQPECTYNTGDVTEALAGTLLTIHAAGQHPPTAVTTVSQSSQPKEDKAKRPTITRAGTTYDWTYFTTRWEEYKSATGITGAKIVMQLLECYEEDLRKDLTRTDGASLRTKPETEVLNAIK